MKIIDFINGKVVYDQFRGKYLWIKEPKGGSKMLAEMRGFKNLRYAEDSDFSKRLAESGLLVHEEFINDVMYYYRYRHENHETKYGFNKDK